MNGFRTRYWIEAEPPKDEEHLHELITLAKVATLPEAVKELAKITDRYARIAKVAEEYEPAPAGKKWKDEEYGWSIIDSEVIKEN